MMDRRQNTPFNFPYGYRRYILMDYRCWRNGVLGHQMKTFSALLAICAGNSPVPGEFPTQRPVTQGFDVFVDLRLNKRLRKQSWNWWFGMQSHPLWRHCNVMPNPEVNFAPTYSILRGTNCVNVRLKFRIGHHQITSLIKIYLYVIFCLIQFCVNLGFLEDEPKKFRDIQSRWVWTIRMLHQWSLSQFFSVPLFVYASKSSKHCMKISHSSLTDVTAAGMRWHPIILADRMSGYRKNHSCQTLLLNMVEQWKQAMNKGWYVGAVLIFEQSVSLSATWTTNCQIESLRTSTVTCQHIDF